jgi:hypothetical protein
MNRMLMVLLSLALATGPSSAQSIDDLMNRAKKAVTEAQKAASDVANPPVTAPPAAQTANQQSTGAAPSSGGQAVTKPAAWTAGRPAASGAPACLEMRPDPKSKKKDVLLNNCSQAFTLKLLSNGVDCHEQPLNPQEKSYYNNVYAVCTSANPSSKSCSCGSGPPLLYGGGQPQDVGAGSQRQQGAPDCLVVDQGVIHNYCGLRRFGAVEVQPDGSCGHAFLSGKEMIPFAKTVAVCEQPNDANNRKSCTCQYATLMTGGATARRP